VNRFNCQDWADLLDDYLDGSLDATRQKLAERHLAACPACQELVAQARTNRAELAPGPDDARLTAAVLAQTSGPACQRAEQLLPDHAAGHLTGADAALLASHLEHCAGCRQIAATLAWLQPLLPELGAIEPDAAFTTAVLQRTSRWVSSGQRLQAFTDRTADRVGRWLERMWQRPRIAFEGAYVAVLLVVGLCALPASPLRDAPPRALALVQAGPEHWSGAVTLLAIVPDQGAAVSRAAWSAVAGPGSPVQRAVDDSERRGARAAPAYGGLRRHVGGFVQHVRQGEPAAAAEQLLATTRDGAALWKAWWRTDDRKTTAPTDNTEP